MCEILNNYNYEKNEISKYKVLGYLLVLCPIIEIAITFAFRVLFGETKTNQISGGFTSIECIHYFPHYELIASLIFTVLCPIIIFISGILLLRTKKNGLTLAIFGFSLNVVARVAFLIFGFFSYCSSQKYTWDYVLVETFITFIVINAFMIVYLIRRKEEILLYKTVI